ncbi:MAG: ATP-binding cassette domain-containing protein [Luteitalea sp.]|nr:ATP-binding cassette domain-containing protein [Luteitalea sp.]
MTETLPSTLSTAAPPVACLRQTTRRYGDVVALDRVDLALAAGQLTALLGPNGAGKTTAVRLLLGLLRPTSGKAELFGRSPQERAARERVGVMLQISGVPPTLTVREHVHLFSAYYPSPLTLHETLERAGLSEVAHRRFGDLSGGQQQRLMFALAICGNPDALFLDEPTAGLDVEGRRAFWIEIRRLIAHGRSILLTTHYLEEADALADRIVVLHQGRIVADGTPATIKQRTAGRRIRCVTSLPPARLEQLPGVRAIQPDRDGFVLLTTTAETTARALLQLDPTISDLEITTARLEDAFLSLTSVSETASASQDVHA